MTIAWVLGSGGLLGAALCRALRHDGAGLFAFPERFSWDCDSELASQIRAAVQAFAFQVEACDGWEIYWAAGVGVMSSSEDDLAPETRALSLLLQLIESEPRLMIAPGAVVFSSSAGAIYAGSPDEVITEDTLPAPTTAYAREKLTQEESITSFAARNRRITALIARITTLYGPLQSARRRQGLLAYIARSILLNQPVQIYVPYDTIRDYIAAGDAAAAMIAALRAMSGKQRILTKIIASEQPTTIAEIVSIFKRVARRAPRIVTGASRLSFLYSRRVQFHSIVLPECPRVPRRSLLIGIAELLAAERATFVQGRTTLSILR